jgi:two-component system, NtrC family, response regulator AtoC
MERRKLLVVDDAPAIVEMVTDHFEAQGYEVESAGSGREAVAHLMGGFDGLVLLDFKLPDVEGLELLDRVRELAPHSAVIMITAHGSIGMAVEAVQNRGAFYVHSKSEEGFLEKLSGTVGNAFRQLDTSRRLRSLESQMGSRYSFASIITRSPLMAAIFRTLQNVVESKVTVLVQGESGTGKELVAKAIHFNGPRRDQPFVAINCAGIPDTLLESELFGYEKGAFTGAYARKAGKFEQAHKGTLFLDEIGEMNLALQAKILRVLQERSFERLGGRDTINVDVRIISATNRDLEVAVETGEFREDLYYRLSVFPVDLPPLRHRMEDVEILAEHFLRVFAQEESKRLEGITPRAMERLTTFHYPGNVRQLENIVAHAVVVATGSKIDAGDLPPYLRAGEYRLSGAGGSPDAAVSLEELLSRRVLPLHRLEALAIRKAIDACNGNVSLASRMLEISRATIYRKLREAKEE